MTGPGKWLSVIALSLAMASPASAQTFEVAGIRLGMTMAEIAASSGRGLLQGLRERRSVDIRHPSGELAFALYQWEGADPPWTKVSLVFSGAGELVAVLREGRYPWVPAPTVEEVMAEAEAKYGRPTLANISADEGAFAVLRDLAGATLSGDDENRVRECLDPVLSLQWRLPTMRAEAPPQLDIPEGCGDGIIVRIGKVQGTTQVELSQILVGLSALRTVLARRGWL